MSVNSSEQVKTIQKILETLEEQKLTLERATSNFNRKKIEVENIIKESQSAVEKAKVSLEQTRIHLRRELEKLDPPLHHCTTVVCDHESHK